MAMLGLIHRIVIGFGPRYFRLAPPLNHSDGKETQRRHNRQLNTHRKGHFLDIVTDSALGLVDVYNLLPQLIVDADDVSTFQKRLQVNLIDESERGTLDWKEMYSPRRTIFALPLRDRMGPCNNDGANNDTATDLRRDYGFVERWLAFAAGNHTHQ